MLNKIRLRGFASQADALLIYNWFYDPEGAYENFFREISYTPTLEDCYRYPEWSGNIINMVELDGKTIGMVNAYRANFKTGTVFAGGLIDKEHRKQLVGYHAQLKWLEYLFYRSGFRKVICEFSDQFLIPRYEQVGFQIEGTHKKECFVDGEWKDEIRMACFREDFRPKYESIEGNMINGSEKIQGESWLQASVHGTA